jgi:enamine deaminase RidA (YjgF/YER057c/UK114 family)
LRPEARLAACAAAALLASCAPRQEPLAPVIRHATANFPIASAVAVPSGYALLFLSGVTASPADPNAPQGSPQYWGDTKTQAISALGKIKGIIEGQGHRIGEVVSMTVYLVADHSRAVKDAPVRMDFDGFMEAYTQFFGAAAAQPDLPARSTVEVVNLAQPGLLVEIEVTLAVPAQ